MTGMIVLWGFVLIVAFVGLFLYDRCPKGGYHDYEIKSSRYFRGQNIGFGLTNSIYLQEKKCKKCGKRITDH